MLIRTSIALTVLFELLTCVMRFGLQLNSTRDTASTIGHITCGIRIHHGYIGALMILIAAWTWTRLPKASWWSVAVGLALVLSDLIHHFCVLWPLTGSPQFDLVYPPELLQQ
jgi:hypothetical protein